MTETKAEKKFKKHNTFKEQTEREIDQIVGDAMSMSVTDAQMQKKRQDMRGKCTHSNPFQMFIGTIIIANALCLGLEVDNGDEYEDVFLILDHTFVSIFLGEMFLRWKVEGIRYYFMDGHSILDFFVVVSSVLDAWIIKPLYEGDNRSLRSMSLFRILRLCRLIRLIRIFSIFKELAIIAQSFAAGARTLLWGGAFVGVVVYVFGIFAVDFFGRASDCTDARMLKAKSKTGRPDEYGESVQSADNCQDTYDFGTTGNQFTLFGSLDRAMLTLYICVTDGCGSDIVYKMVYKTPWVMAFWYSFVFITSFGLVNVMVGLFCENVFAKAVENEKELAALHVEKRMEVLQYLCTIFVGMDKDRSQSITRDEFMNAMQNDPQVQKAMIELELHESLHVFDVLDVDQSGILTLKEFVQGALLFTSANEPTKVKDTIGTYLLCQAILKHTQAISESLGVSSPGRSASQSPRECRVSSGVQSPEQPSKSSESKNPETGETCPSFIHPAAPKKAHHLWLQNQFEMLHGVMSEMNGKMDNLSVRMDQMSERQEQLEFDFRKYTKGNRAERL